MNRNATFSLNELVIKNMTDFCHENHISKSAFVSNAITSYISMQKAFGVDSETQRQLNEFSRRYKLVEPYIDSSLSEIPEDILSELRTLQSDLKELSERDAERLD